MKTAQNFSMKKSVVTVALIGICFASFAQMALAADKNDEAVKHEKTNHLKSDKADANNDVSNNDAHKEEVRVDRRDELRERHIEEHHEHN